MRYEKDTVMTVEMWTIMRTGMMQFPFFTGSLVSRYIKYMQYLIISSVKQQLF